MELTLHYRGPLGSNNVKQKHVIRQHFHTQLKVLWDMMPLSLIKSRAVDPASPHNPVPGAWDQLTPVEQAKRLLEFPSLVKVVDGQQFVPLVASKLYGIAELDITMLRPEPPGRIITQGGDIDNRLKTLFDALKVPDVGQAKPQQIGQLEQPFFCLLEDDNLIVRVSVKTEQLLEPTSDPQEVILLINVKTRRTQETTNNIVMA